MKRLNLSHDGVVRWERPIRQRWLGPAWFWLMRRTVCRWFGHRNRTDVGVVAWNDPAGTPHRYEGRPVEICERCLFMPEASLVLQHETMHVRNDESIMVTGAGVHMSNISVIGHPFDPAWRGETA